MDVRGRCRWCLAPTGRRRYCPDTGCRDDYQTFGPGSAFAAAEGIDVGDGWTGFARQHLLAAMAGAVQGGDTKAFIAVSRELRQHRRGGPPEPEHDPHPMDDFDDW